MHFIFFVVAYLIGSIPFGLLFYRMSSGKDIRKHGSGNIGTTNAFRAGGKVIGILTMVGDITKGAIVVFLAKNFFPQEPEIAIYSGFLAILGHVFSIWLRFKGGKGVATTLGVVMSLNAAIGIVAIVSMIIILLLTRIVSVASMLTACVATLYTVSLHSKDMLIMMIAVTVLILYCHRDNIKRLYQGKEKKFF